MLISPVEFAPLLQQPVERLCDFGVMRDPYVVERARSQESPNLRDRITVTLHRRDGFYLIGFDSLLCSATTEPSVYAQKTRTETTMKKDTGINVENPQ